VAVAINLEALRALEVNDMRFAYGERETMLYALSVGMGRDPLDTGELPFVFEGAGLRAVPTMAVVLASTGIIRKLGVDFSKILHGAQQLILHRQLPIAGELLANSRVAGVYDKGAGKGAVLELETAVRSAVDGGARFFTGSRPTVLLAARCRGPSATMTSGGCGPSMLASPRRSIRAMKSLPTFGAMAMSFRCRVPGRDVVLNNGRCLLNAPS
jgi:hypothetical protein